jgi:ABC-type bacteriocin/lantibiotic exporter with double-glycine peptidase domain
VEVERSTYDEAVRRGEPFLAHIAGGVLGHAVTIVQMTPEGVVILDPATGQPYALTRQTFEAEWDGTAVRLVR